jgi:LmbE family N-acetylglucosaminyl deacetylase
VSRGREAPIVVEPVDVWSDRMVTDALEPMPEDWTSALAVVAHPDDMEYGAASAVARWTAAGKDVRYLLVTRGEAGIASMPPAEVGPIREREQRRSCAAVGVAEVEPTVGDPGELARRLAGLSDRAGATRGAFEQLAAEFGQGRPPEAVEKVQGVVIDRR